MSDHVKRDESFGALFEASTLSARRQVSRYSPGQELDVIVSQIGRDAVFVDLDDKQQGFIESKELQNEAGELIVKVGSRVHARITEVGGKAGAVRLAPVVVRQIVDQVESVTVLPVAAGAAAPVVVGAKVLGVVCGVERYGVFLQLNPEKQGRPERGLIPVGELGLPRGTDLHKHFPQGKQLEAKIVAIDERGRIRLSLSALAVDDERSAFEKFQGEKKTQDRAAKPSMGTLGDLLSKSRK